MFRRRVEVHLHQVEALVLRHQIVVAGVKVVADGVAVVGHRIDMRGIGVVQLARFGHGLLGKLGARLDDVDRRLTRARALGPLELGPALRARLALVAPRVARLFVVAGRRGRLGVGTRSVSAGNGEQAKQSGRKSNAHDDLVRCR